MINHFYIKYNIHNPYQTNDNTYLRIVSEYRLTIKCLYVIKIDV